MGKSTFDFGNSTKRLDPSYRKLIEPHLCGRWDQGSAAFFYHAALYACSLEMALSTCLLNSRDLTDCELRFSKKLYTKACSEKRADIFYRLKSGRLESENARILLRNLCDGN